MRFFLLAAVVLAAGLGFGSVAPTSADDPSVFVTVGPFDLDIRKPQKHSSDDKFQAKVYVVSCNTCSPSNPQTLDIFVVQEGSQVRGTRDPKVINFDPSSPHLLLGPYSTACNGSQSQTWHLRSKVDWNGNTDQGNVKDWNGGKCDLQN